MSTRTTPRAAEPELESYRRELTGYCYRMLGSGFEAEDAVQETMVRAWRSIDRFEGRSSLRSWLYRIATNVCLDMHRGPQRRARPMDLGPSAGAGSDLGPIIPESEWVLPMADERHLPTDGDPGEVAAARESVRLAFVAALQLLPPRQRAVLILREVLHWHADEVAELLETSVASVNSALQRARATMAASDVGSVDGAGEVTDPVAQALLARYVEAFERYDVEALVALLREDATMSMPPWPLWLRGPNEIAEFFLGTGIGCQGSRVLVTDSANGFPTVATYKPTGDGTWEPWALQILEMSGDRISAINNFIYPELFAAFGLPDRLD